MFSETIAEVPVERIRELRQAKGVSQAKLAVTAGMDPATLNRIEQGKANPNLRTLEKLADALGVGVAELFPKAQAPLWSDSPPTERRSSIFGGFIVSAADKLLHLVSEPGKNNQKLVGISDAANALGEAIDEHVDDAYWDSLPNEERLEIIRGMEEITEVIERVTQVLGDEILEGKARQNRQKIWEWTRRISA